MKQNKKSLFRLLLLLLTVSLFSAGCHRPDKGTSTQSGFRNDQTGIEYVLCNPLAVKPLALDTEQAYCVAGEDSYYAIPFEEPTSFVADLDAESGSSFVYRNKDLSDITVGTFGAISAMLYLDGLSPRPVAQLYADDQYLPPELQGQNTSQDTALVQKMTDALTNGESRTVPVSEQVQDEVYYFRLLSNLYPGLYYNICFFADIYGKYYLEDLATRKTVDAPDELVAWFVG